MLDALLETINTMKEVQRNYEQEVELYAFDYKNFFDKSVSNRERVYNLQLIPHDDTDESDDDKNSKADTVS